MAVLIGGCIQSGKDVMSAFWRKRLTSYWIREANFQVKGGIQGRKDSGLRSQPKCRNWKLIFRGKRNEICESKSDSFRISQPFRFHGFHSIAIADMHMNPLMMEYNIVIWFLPSKLTQIYLDRKRFCPCPFGAPQDPLPLFLMVRARLLYIYIERNEEKNRRKDIK